MRASNSEERFDRTELATSLEANIDKLAATLVKGQTASIGSPTSVDCEHAGDCTMHIVVHRTTPAALPNRSIKLAGGGTISFPSSVVALLSLSAQSSIVDVVSVWYNRDRFEGMPQVSAPSTNGDVVEILLQFENNRPVALFGNSENINITLPVRSELRTYPLACMTFVTGSAKWDDSGIGTTKIKNDQGEVIGVTCSTKHLSFYSIHAEGYAPPVTDSTTSDSATPAAPTPQDSAPVTNTDDDEGSMTVSSIIWSIVAILVLIFMILVFLIKWCYERHEPNILTLEQEESLGDEGMAITAINSPLQSQTPKMASHEVVYPETHHRSEELIAVSLDSGDATDGGLIVPPPPPAAREPVRASRDTKDKSAPPPTQTLPNQYDEKPKNSSTATERHPNRVVSTEEPATNKYANQVYIHDDTLPSQLQGSPRAIKDLVPPPPPIPLITPAQVAPALQQHYPPLTGPLHPVLPVGGLPPHRQPLNSIPQPTLPIAAGIPMQQHGVGSPAAGVVAPGFPRPFPYPLSNNSNGQDQQQPRSPPQAFSKPNFSYPLNQAPAPQKMGNPLMKPEELSEIAREKMRELTPDLGITFYPNSLTIASMAPSGPAVQAKLMVGDTIVGIDGSKTQSVGDYALFMEGMYPGRQVTVEVWRKGKSEPIRARLGCQVPQYLFMRLLRVNRGHIAHDDYNAIPQINTKSTTIYAFTQDFIT
eukprot:TRINITY_DN67746_c6_g10_i1.p1 TRINITY_DN67746_c6_g10~~TRINITY_DN67746_c6_g10_i1.p1  ORF type:complete len:796 (-),score=45.18 TRINITY_DN67746_c6_g10_i1:116-2230(-)